MKVILFKAAFKCPDENCRLSGYYCAECFRKQAQYDDYDIDDLTFDESEKVDLKNLQTSDRDNFLVNQVLKNKVAWTQKTFKIKKKEKVNGTV